MQQQRWQRAVVWSLGLMFVMGASPAVWAITVEAPATVQEGKGCAVTVTTTQPNIPVTVWANAQRLLVGITDRTGRLVQLFPVPAGTAGKTYTLVAIAKREGISAPINVTVVKDAGVAAAITFPPNPMTIAPYTAQFGGTTSASPTGPAMDLQYAWHVGDDYAGVDPSADPPTDDGMLAAHRYEQPGTYTVTLTVTDPATNISDSTQTTLTVVPFSGATSYVSSSTGSDANDGKSPATAWQNLGYALGKMGGSPGNPNKLLLKRGDSWTSASGEYVPGPAILDAYGDPSQAKPVMLFTNVADSCVLNLGDVRSWGLSRIINNLHLKYPGAPRTKLQVLESRAHGNVVRNCVLENGGFYAPGYGGNVQSLVLEETTVIDGSRVGWYAQYHDWLTGRRNTFVGSGSDPTATFDHQIYLSGNTNILLEDSVFDGALTGLNNSGVKLTYAVDVLARRLEIKHSRLGFDHGTNPGDSRPPNDNVIIDQCLIHDLGVLDQSCAVWVGRAVRTIISNCLIHTMKLAPNWGVAGINLSTADPGADVRIYNNTFYGNQVPDIKGGRGPNYAKVEIKNNVFHRVASSPPKDNSSFFEIWNPGQFLPILESDGNLFFWEGQTPSTLTFAVGGPPVTDSFNTWRSVYGQDANSMFADPQFTNAAGYDFTLQPGSPAIDTGLSLPVVREDFAGTPRPNDGDASGTAEHDLGAYEL